MSPEPVLIPCCWLTAEGACGCGRDHREKAIAKAPLVAWAEYVTSPPTASTVAQWRHTWPRANWAELLEPVGVLEVDVDSDAALDEATALGLPPSPVMKTARGRRYRYQCPRALAGIRITHKGSSRHIDLMSGGYVIVEGRHRFGDRYEWIVTPREHPPGAAPRWALDWLARAREERPAPAVADDRWQEKKLSPNSQGFSDRGTFPAQTSVDLVDLTALDLHPRIVAVIETGEGPTYPSRSEAVHAVVLHLLKRGVDDATIASILLDARYGISAKPRQQGRRWLAGELARARRKLPQAVRV
jgi:Bifunctional DNA primase/polymerase, N-terminal